MLSEVLDPTVDLNYRRVEHQISARDGVKRAVDLDAMGGVDCQIANRGKDLTGGNYKIVRIHGAGKLLAACASDSDCDRNHERRQAYFQPRIIHPRTTRATRLSTV